MPASGNCRASGAVSAVARAARARPSWMTRSPPISELDAEQASDRADAVRYVSVPKLEVLDTDITTLEVDAIANAANTQLLHGGGVAGAIARAGGEAVNRESREKAPIDLGEAVETSAGDMPSKWVIHAATMELGGPTSADIIRRA